MSEREERLEKTLLAIDAINKKDERKELFEGKEYPKEYLYALRAYEILLKYWPDASELLKISVRGHHIQRWFIPRSNYPMDRKGYLQWRTQLKLHHSEVIGKIMTEYGYSEEEIKKVGKMITKVKLKTDADTQTLEDVICLVFMHHYLDEFAVKHSREKVVNIIKKTWAKMTNKGHEFALTIDFSSDASSLVKEALS